MALSRVVIVGAGLGGLAAAKALGKTPAQIILIDLDELLFRRPPQGM
jgi:NADH dehydrogenase FAD-containing subunit